LLAQVLNFGIEAPWNDNNEFRVLNDDAIVAGFGSRMRLGSSRALMPLLMAHASYSAALAHAPGVRPFVLTRSASVGAQRYAQVRTVKTCVVNDCVSTDLVWRQSYKLAHVAIQRADGTVVSSVGSCQHWQ
jgi:hypothetical protein